MTCIQRFSGELWSNERLMFSNLCNLTASPYNDDQLIVYIRVDSSIIPTRRMARLNCKINKYIHTYLIESDPYELLYTLTSRSDNHFSPFKQSNHPEYVLFHFPAQSRMI